MDNDNLIEFIEEYADNDTITLMEEMIPYELIHDLLKQVSALTRALKKSRDEKKVLIEGKSYTPYSTMTQDSPGFCYDGHPAMERYLEIYREHAVEV
jgi:hypothetical protein